MPADDRPSSQQRPTSSAAGAEVIDWNAIAVTDRFRALVRAKRRFIVPAMVFFVVYYFTLPVLVGYFPQLMQRKVIGSVNVAYLFALSQFFMAWAVAAAYVRVAAKWDRMAADIRGSVGHR